MKILVCVDLSDFTETVVKQAEELAQATSAQVWVLHVANPEPDFVGYEVGPQSVRDDVANEYHAQHIKVQEISNRMRNAGVEATALLVQGAIVETIFMEAMKLEVTLIIVGSHRHGAVHKFLIGSVSDGVLQRAQCPVLVVPTQTGI